MRISDFNARRLPAPPPRTPHPSSVVWHLNSPIKSPSCQLRLIPINTSLLNHSQNLPTITQTQQLRSSQVSASQESSSVENAHLLDEWISSSRLPSRKLLSELSQIFQDRPRFALVSLLIPALLSNNKFIADSIQKLLLASASQILPQDVIHTVMMNLPKNTVLADHAVPIAQTLASMQGPSTDSTILDVLTLMMAVDPAVQISSSKFARVLLSICQTVLHENIALSVPTSSTLVRLVEQSETFLKKTCLALLAKIVSED